MKKKAILIISSLVLAFTLYSFGMLFAQYKISTEVTKSIDKIAKNTTDIQSIAFSRITLSPLFFINKKYYINNCFIKFKNIPSDIYINKISISDFFINDGQVIPKYIKADKIEFFNLNKVKEQIKNLSPILNQSETTLNYFLNSPSASFKADFQYGQYNGEFKLFLNNKIILNTSYNLKNIIPFSNKNLIIFNLKTLRLNLENIPIDSQKSFPDNKILLEILGEDYKDILLNININYQKTTQNNENKSTLFSNIDFQKIINIKLTSNFHIDNILKPDESIVNESIIQLTDHNFLEEYYKKEAKKQNLTLDEVKKEAIKQNDIFLLFISNTPLEDGVHEFNQFILKPNKFTITINPQKPITLQKLKAQGKEDYFGLLHFLKIKFKANSDFIDQEEDNNSH